MNFKVAMESLGCSKNLVDSEVMLGILKNKGFRLTGEYECADIIIVNTCGFIESAKMESINTILEYAQYKKSGNLKLLIVTGCLAQRYSDDLKAEIPEIDAIVGTASYPKIYEIIKDLFENKDIVMVDDVNFVYDETLPRYLSTPSYMGYLKIGEGCDNCCTYCIIPKLRGKYRSRKIEDLLIEAKNMASQGVKEIVVIAQDTTKYGIDLYDEPKLGYLLSELSKIEDIQWIRVLYSYPESITKDLIDVINSSDKICSYFDIPIQHCNNRILKLMNRRTTKEDILDKIKLIRENISGASIRTSIIVGFPGETDEEYKELEEFVKTVEFDRLGVFTYSKEEDTPAAKLDGQIDEDIKVKRRDALMMIQQEISLAKNVKKVDNIYKVLVEEKVEDNLYMGRTYADAYEIDGIVYIKTNGEINIGEFVDVKINEGLEYDLMGEITNEFAK